MTGFDLHPLPQMRYRYPGDGLLPTAESAWLPTGTSHRSVERTRGGDRTGPRLMFPCRFRSMLATGA